jgi:hypothetical protein
MVFLKLGWSLHFDRDQFIVVEDLPGRGAEDSDRVDWYVPDFTGGQYCAQYQERNKDEGGCAFHKHLLWLGMQTHRFLSGYSPVEKKPIAHWSGQTVDPIAERCPKSFGQGMQITR